MTQTNRDATTILCFLRNDDNFCTIICSQASFIWQWFFYEIILHLNKMLMQHHVATTDPNTVWHKNVLEWGYGGANIGYYFEKTRPHATSKMCHV